MTMHKNGKRLLAILLAALLLLALPLSAWAATVYQWTAADNYEKGDTVTYGGDNWVAQIDNPTATPGTDTAQWTKGTKVKDDSVSVNKTQLQSGKINLGNIQMTGEKSDKFILIEKAAMEYAAQQGMNVGVSTNYMSVSFPAAAVVNSAEWKKAATSSTTFSFIMEIDDDYGVSLSQALSATAQSQLGCTSVSPDGLGFEFYFRGGNQSYTYIYQLAEDMTLTYNYTVNYRGATRRPAEKSLALVWADIDKKLSTAKVTNVLLDSLVDLNNQTVTVKTPYTCGAYVLAGQNNADNTKTTLGGSTGNPALSGEVNTKGVPGWAAANVAQMQEAKVISSDLTGKNFSAPISRAEFAAYIVRLLGVSSETATNPFKDLNTDNPYYNEILAASKAGLVAGRTANTFAPDASITRQEMAVLFSRAMAYAHADTSTDLTKLNQFADAKTISDWAKNSAAICVNAGLIAGRANGFAPLENTSWTEAVVMLSRLDGLL